MNKNWLGLNFQKRETRTIEAPIATSALLTSVLFVGITSDDRYVEEISGHILNSELAGTKSYSLDIKLPPARVRDFTIDPYQDLLIFTEESMIG